MNGRLIQSLVCGALVAGMVSESSAAEPVIQNINGWKITIQPGDFSVRPEADAHIPPSPSVAPELNQSRIQSAVKLISLRQQENVERPKPLAPAPEPNGGDLPTIAPCEDCEKTGIVSVDPPAGRVDPRYLSQMYYEIYKSIPFIRAEYDANPSYIHDATMEMLFGQMRPTVIQRGSTTVYHNYSGYGAGYGGYAYPPLQLVIPGVGLRIHRSNDGFVE